MAAGTSLAGHIADYRGRMVEIMQGACMEVSTRVVMATPIQDGDLRRAWTPARNTVDFSNRGGSITATARQMRPGDSYSLGNGMPYVLVIEYEGHSKIQAPQGMMHVNLASWDAIVGSEAARLR